MLIRNRPVRFSDAQVAHRYPTWQIRAILTELPPRASWPTTESSNRVDESRLEARMRTRFRSTDVSSSRGA